jgi:hypothetical protein
MEMRIGPAGLSTELPAVQPEQPVGRLARGEVADGVAVRIDDLRRLVGGAVRRTDLAGVIVVARFGIGHDRSFSGATTGGNP